jgi:nitroreductase
VQFSHCKRAKVFINHHFYAYFCIYRKKHGKLYIKEMSNFQELLIKRRSIRRFTEELLLPEETEKILKAALLSPTSKNGRSWQFIAVENKEMLQKLAKCKPHSATFIEECALAVVVLGNPLISDVWIEDASIASFSMQLQAEDIGVGSCWVQIREREYNENIPAADYVRDLLDVPMPFEVLSIIAFGKKIKERRPNDVESLTWENVHIDKFEL